MKRYLNIIMKFQSINNASPQVSESKPMENKSIKIVKPM